MDERMRKAYDFAADAVKQIITLSTAIIGLTVTFLKDVLGDATARTWPLRTAWVLYAVAILFGVWALLSLTGSLGDKRIKTADLDIYSGNAVIPMVVVVIAFVGAVGLTVFFGWSRL